MIGEKVRRVLRYVAQGAVIVLLIVAGWIFNDRITDLRTAQEEEEARSATITSILAESCGTATFKELREQGLIEECRLAQAGELNEVLTKDDLSDPDVDPEDVDPDVVEDRPGSTVAPAPEPRGPTNDQVQAAVDDYFADNPITTSAVYQTTLSRAVAAYLRANPPRDGRPPTDAEIAAAARNYLIANPPEDGEDGEGGPVGPAGPIGPPGTDGVSVTDVACVDGKFVFTLSDDSTVAPLGDCVAEQGPTGPPGPKGEEGEKGDTGVVEVRTDGCEGPLISSITTSYDVATRTIVVTCNSAANPGGGGGGGSN